MPDDEATFAFHAFFERHYADLSRLAYLMTGEVDVADDLAADALVELWRHWDRASAADDMLAYAQGLVAGLSRTWVRRQGRERRGVRWFGLLGHERADKDTDVAAVLDIRDALTRLPYRRRACVVLRYGFDLSERTVADILEISVGTVKSHTSRGAAQLARLLQHQAQPDIALAQAFPGLGNAHRQERES